VQTDFTPVLTNTSVQDTILTADFGNMTHYFVLLCYKSVAPAN